MKKLFFIFLFFYLGWVQAAPSSQPAQSLSVRYEFTQGGPSVSATREITEVKNSTLTLVTDYIPTEFGSDVSKRIQTQKTYVVKEEKMKLLKDLILQSGFMNWVNEILQKPAQSGDQVFEIELDGKKISHSMWEMGNQEKFREFSRLFNLWAKQRMTVEF